MISYECSLEISENATVKRIAYGNQGESFIKRWYNHDAHKHGGHRNPAFDIDLDNYFKTLKLLDTISR